MLHCKSILTSKDRKDVEIQLETGPNFQQDPHIMLKVTITLICQALVLLLYVNNFFDLIVGDLVKLEPQALAPAAAPTSSVRHQEPHPSKQTRCKWCHALRHDTNDCHSKDLVAVKKQVSNNQKVQK